MKAISLWQPWASLWLSPHKVHETRHWETRHVGWTIVHAAKKKIPIPFEDPLAEMIRHVHGDHWRLDMPFGAILGAVDLESCTRMRNTAPEHQDDMEAGNWSDERFAWRRGQFITLAEPISYRGMQGLFNVTDPAILQVITTQISRETTP